MLEKERRRNTKVTDIMKTKNDQERMSGREAKNTKSRTNQVKMWIIQLRKKRRGKIAVATGRVKTEKDQDVKRTKKEKFLEIGMNGMIKEELDHQRITTGANTMNMMTVDTRYFF